MKKIIFIIDTNTSGGAERVVSILANWFADNGYDTTIINSDSDSDFYHIDKKVKVIKLKLDKKYHFLFGNVFRLLDKIHILKKYFKDNKPDAAVTFLFHMEMPAIIAGLATNTKVFTSIRNSINSYNKFETLFRKITYPKIAGVVFQSNQIQSLDIFKNVNSAVIMNPLKIENFDKFEIIPFCRRKNWIISVGRLSKQKNQKLLIDAFCTVADKYPELELHIFGEGTLRNELQAHIDSTKYAGRIFLEGNLLNASYIHKDSKIFVLSSDYEGFPNALVEAMAYGIPVISSDFDSGVASQIITDKINGCLFEPKNKTDLADKMEYILSLKEDAYNQMVSEEQKIADLIDIDKIGKKWEYFIFN